MFNLAKKLLLSEKDNWHFSIYILCIRRFRGCSDEFQIIDADRSESVL